MAYKWVSCPFITNQNLLANRGVSTFYPHEIELEIL